VWRLSCPTCGAEELWVVAGSFSSRIPLAPDGFAFCDAKFVDTEDELVECGACAARFPLAALDGTWLQHHKASEAHAAAAELASRHGDAAAAKALYAQAAEAEETALAFIEPDQTRTLGVTVISAVALRCKAGQFELAESLAVRWLRSKRLPGFAADQLRVLLRSTGSGETEGSVGGCEPAR